MAVLFDNTADYLEYASGPTGTCTLAGWFVPDSIGTLHTLMCIGSAAPGAYSGNATSVYIDASGNLNAWITAQVSIGISVSADEPVFAALTRNGDGGSSTTWTAYGGKRGAALSATAGQINAGWNLTGNRLQIATSAYAAAGSENFLGRAGPVWAFDSVLTAAELDVLRHHIYPFKPAWLWLPGIWTGADRNTDFSGNGRDFTEGGTLADGDGAPITWGAPILVPQKNASTAPTLSAPGVQDITSTSARLKVTLTYA